MLVDFHWWYPERFLPDFGGPRIVSAWHGSPDIGLMPLGSRPGYEFIFVKNRLIDSHIVVLIPQRENIVMEDDITRIDLLAEVIHDVLAHRPEGEGKDGQVFSLLEHLALSIIQSGHKILGLAENRAIVSSSP